MIELIKILLATSRKGSWNVKGIGIAIPGSVDPESGFVWAPNIEGWSNLDLFKALHDAVKFNDGPIVIDCDRSCYILGEQWKGNAKGCTDAIYLAVGTGIGAGILCNGQILNGRSGIAGAIGWMALDRPYLEDYQDCGCFEFHASGTGLAKNFHRSMDINPLSNAHLTKSQAYSAKDVFTGYRNGDTQAVKIIERAIGYWGMATANLISLFNPEIIIFGGGIFGPAVSLIDEIRSEAEKWAQPLSFKQVKMTGSALGRDAGLFGAARLAINTMH